MLGEHTEEILVDLLGYSTEDVMACRQVGAI
jgi:hypothetical protein